MSDNEPVHATDGSDAHLSDLTIDRMIAGELDGSDQARAIREHLAACGACGARHQSFVAAAAAFSALAAQRRLAPSVEGRLSGARWWRGGALVAVAACAALAFWGARRVPSNGADELRAKGDLSLEVWVARSTGRVETLLPQGRVSPGDRLRFGIGTVAPGYLAIASVDGAKNVTLYVPVAPARPPLVAPGHHLLDGAIALDSVLGTERLIAVRCPRPLDPQLLVSAVGAMAREAVGGVVVPSPRSAMAGCATTTFSLEKVAAP